MPLVASLVWLILATAVPSAAMGDQCTDAAKGSCLLAKHTFVHKRYEASEEAEPEEAELEEAEAAAAGGAPTDLAGMQSFLQAQVLLANGTTNMTGETKAALDVIKGYVQTMKTSAITQHGEDQIEVNQSLNMIAQCEAGSPSASDLNGDVAQKRADHAQCRTREADKAGDESTKCQAYTFNRKGTYASPPVCSLDKAATDDATELEAFELCLREFKKYIQLYDIYEACHAATVARSNQTQLCNKQQGALEMSACLFATKHGDTCACRKRETEVYLERRRAIEASEAARKADHTVAVHIECLFGALLSPAATKRAAVNKCIQAPVSTQHLSIIYGTVPSAAVGCDANATKPCSNSWLSQEYQSQAWFSKAPTTACTACPSPSTTTTTTTTTTPTAGLTTAGFEYITMNKCGTSPGKLWKITGSTAWNCMAFDTRTTIDPTGAGPQGISFRCPRCGQAYNVGLQQARGLNGAMPVASDPSTWDTSSRANFKRMHDDIVTDSNCVSNDCGDNSYDFGFDAGFSCRKNGRLYAMYNNREMFVHVGTYQDDNILKLAVSGNKFQWFIDGQLVLEKQGVLGTRASAEISPLWMVAGLHNPLGENCALSDITYVR